MDFNTERLCLPVMLLLLLLARVFSSEDVVEATTPEPETEIIRDCAAENSIKEMMDKLESVVTPRGFCSNQAATEPPMQCFDLTSSQSVVTQLCDRLTALDTKVSGLASKVNLNFASNHNSKDGDQDKPFTQIAKLKEEIKQIKRSVVFYASRRDNIGNFTHQKVLNYNATVNSGPYFDPANGIFAAPFEGIYHFSLSYQKPPEVNLEACLIVDSLVIASTSEVRQPKIDLMTSLRSGQEVWTDITSNSIPTDSEVSIVFSGFLVH